MRRLLGLGWGAAAARGWVLIHPHPWSQQMGPCCLQRLMACLAAAAPHPLAARHAQAGGVADHHHQHWVRLQGGLPLHGCADGGELPGAVNQPATRRTAVAPSRHDPLALPAGRSCSPCAMHMHLDPLALPPPTARRPSPTHTPQASCSTTRWTTSPRPASPTCTACPPAPPTSSGPASAPPQA